MSKERLEELETKYSTLTVSSEKNGTEYTEVDVEDLVFLIQNGFKQAERVQELERVNSQLERQAPGIELELLNMELTDALKQNKRYREVINKFFELDGSYKDIVNRAERMFIKVLDETGG